MPTVLGFADAWHMSHLLFLDFARTRNFSNLLKQNKFSKETIDSYMHLWAVPTVKTDLKKSSASADTTIWTSASWYSFTYTFPSRTIYTEKRTCIFTSWDGLTLLSFFITLGLCHCTEGGTLLSSQDYLAGPSGCSHPVSFSLGSCEWHTNTKVGLHSVKHHLNSRNSNIEKKRTSCFGPSEPSRQTQRKLEAGFERCFLSVSLTVDGQLAELFACFPVDPPSLLKNCKTSFAVR